VAVSFVNSEKKVKQIRFSIEAIDEKHWRVNYKTAEENGVGTLRFFGHATNASAFIRDNNLYFGNGKDIPNKISSHRTGIKQGNCYCRNACRRNQYLQWRV